MQRGDFRVRVLHQQAAAIPAADEIELERHERGLKRTRFTRKLAAKFDALEAKLLDITQDRVQRRVAAEFGHIVIGPGDRAHAKTNAHVFFSLILSS